MRQGLRIHLKSLRSRREMVNWVQIAKTPRPSKTHIIATPSVIPTPPHSTNSPPHRHLQTRITADVPAEPRDETRSKNSPKKLAIPEGNGQLDSNCPNSKAPENLYQHYSFVTTNTTSAQECSPTQVRGTSPTRKRPPPLDPPRTLGIGVR